MIWKNLQVSLTSKFKVSCSADDGAAAVDGETLVRARVPSRLWAADHQAAGHQSVALQAQRDLSAIQEPPAKQRRYQQMHV